MTRIKSNPNILRPYLSWEYKEVDNPFTYEQDGRWCLTFFEKDEHDSIHSSGWCTSKEAATLAMLCWLVGR